MVDRSDEHLNSVFRALAHPARRAILRRIARAEQTVTELAEAWTRPELMARWFFAGDGWTTKVTANLKVGGRYELAMRDTAGAVHEQFGEYREIVPVTRLVFTWSCPALAVVDSVVTISLIDLGASTELVLTHVLPADPKIRRGHEEGWQGCLDNLEKLLHNHNHE